MNGSLLEKRKKLMQCKARAWIPSDDPYCGLNLACTLSDSHEGLHKCTVLGTEDGLDKPIQFEPDSTFVIRWEIDTSVHDN